MKLNPIKINGGIIKFKIFCHPAIIIRLPLCGSGEFIIKSLKSKILFEMPSIGSIKALFKSDVEKLIGENKLTYFMASIPPITDIGIKYPAKVIVSNINDNPINWTLDDFLETEAKTIPVAIEVRYSIIIAIKTSPQLMWPSDSAILVFKKHKKRIITKTVEKQHIRKNQIVTIRLYLIGVILDVEILRKITECFISTNIWGSDISVTGKTDKAIKAGKASTKNPEPFPLPLFSII